VFPAHNNKNNKTRPTNGTTTTTTAAAIAGKESVSHPQQPQQQQQQQPVSKADDNRSFVPRPEMIPHGSPLLSPNVPTESTANRGWTVRPGYSSGASSCSAGSMGKGDEKKEEKEVETNKLDATKYLNRLRMEMQEKGDIASTVVPIEVSECCVFLDITVFVLASHIIICEG